MKLDRRAFTLTGSATMAAWLTRSLWAERVAPLSGPGKFYFAVIADTHIIDPFYHGHENSAEDRESILHTTERLISARDLINSLTPRIEQTFLVGDYFHNYPSPDYDFYFQNETRLDRAKAITDAFKMPLHLGFGNHDYDVKNISREMSHRLFAAKFNTKPYSVVDYKGWKFVMLNNFLGDTQNRTSNNFNSGIGSFGEEQLQWLEAQLQQHRPTFLFTHYPLVAVQSTEFGNYGLQPLLHKYADTIQAVITGHMHRWIDFGRKFGPQHYVIAATRYDNNAYMLVEVDTQRATWKFLNEDLVEWSTHYSKPYVGQL